MSFTRALLSHWRPRLSMWMVCTAVFWGLLTVKTQAAAQQPPAVQITETTDSVKTWPVTRVFFDTGDTSTWQQVASQPEIFQSPSTAESTFGFHQKPVWLSIPIETGEGVAGQWMLDIAYPTLQHIGLFLLKNGQLVQEGEMGSLHDSGPRPMPTRSHSFELQLDDNSRYELLLRVQSTGAIIVPVSINRPAFLMQQALSEQIFLGMLLGLALGALFYSFLQWVHLRDVLYLSFALFSASTSLFFLHYFGLGSQYFWGFSPWMENHAAGFFSMLTNAGFFYFSAKALSGHAPKSRFHRLMLGSALLNMAAAVAYGVDLYGATIVPFIAITCTILPMFLGIPRIIRMARQRHQVGLHVLLGWMGYAVMAVVVISTFLGHMGINFWSKHAALLISALNMLLFMRILNLRSLAMHSSARSLHAEREELHSLAHSDPLTNLSNRRGLHAALQTAIQQCSADNFLALYAIDLDGFKSVNDHHGHYTGDALLMAVASRLKSLVRHSDMVARLGGDEFVIMVNRLQSAQQAEDVGNKLLRAFQSPLVVDGQDFYVGMTIGYALAPEDSSDAIELLQLADAAMYEGKNSGKFCLRRRTNHMPILTVI